MKILRHWLYTGKTYHRDGVTVMWIYCTRQNETGAEMKGISKGSIGEQKLFISLCVDVAISTVYCIR